VREHLLLNKLCLAGFGILTRVGDVYLLLRDNVRYTNNLLFYRTF
jgi:hypothetical protein